MWQAIDLKKIPMVILLVFVNNVVCFGQKGDFFLSGSVNVPIGDFSTTHWLGVGAAISSVTYPCDSAKQGKTSFTYSGGISYFFAGQRQKVSGFSYDYNSYYFVYGLGGIVFRPVIRLNMTVEAGPALSFHQKTTRFNIAAKWSAAYFLDCNLSAGPSIFMIRESGASPLWSMGLSLNFRL